MTSHFTGTRKTEDGVTKIIVWRGASSDDCEKQAARVQTWRAAADSNTLDLQYVLVQHASSDQAYFARCQPLLQLLTWQDINCTATTCARNYGAPLVPLQKIFFIWWPPDKRSGGHHIVIWWSPHRYVVAMLSGGHQIMMWWPLDKKYFLQWYQRGSVRSRFTNVE